MCSSVIGRLLSVCEARDSISPRYCEDSSKLILKVKSNPGLLSAYLAPDGDVSLLISFPLSPGWQVL